MNTEKAGRKAMKTVALAGQPNCGKSTVFTMLTGVHQHIANYPGITVDIKRGFMKHEGKGPEIVDLPGMYSLTSFSEEEKAACRFLLEHTPDLIVNVVDASNLARHLYLTLQLVETGVPVLLNLNMMDLARRASKEINVEVLSRELGVPVVPTEASREKGKKELKTKVAEEAGRASKRASVVNYGKLEGVLGKVASKLEGIGGLPLNPRWIALKLLEEDEAIWEFCNFLPETAAARGRGFPLRRRRGRKAGHAGLAVHSSQEARGGEGDNGEGM